MKIICVGRNYADHAKELNNDLPTEPVIFLKPDSAILRKGFPFYIPEFSNEIHYETEVVIKIDRVGRHIAPEFAHRYFSEIGLGLDFTARDLQNELKGKGLPWELSKAFDHSAFVSEFYPKIDFDLKNINFNLLKNGVKVQDGHTTDFIFKIENLIAYISKFFTLKKGDLIFTGTPAGVGKVIENDILEGFLEQKKVFEVRIK